MSKTVLDPMNENAAGLSPRQRRPQRQQGRGQGLVNALSPQEWFQISSAFLNPEYNFGTAALLASQGIAHDRRTQALQERENQMWQRQQQSWEREDAQRASLEETRETIAAFYENRGDGETAALVRQLPPEMALQHMNEMTPAGRREVELFNAQLAQLRASTQADQARASQAGIPGYGDPVRYTVPGPDGASTVISYYEPETPGQGAPMAVLPGGQVLQGEGLQQVMSAARREASRTITGEDWAPDDTDVRRYRQQIGNSGAFLAATDVLTEALTESGNPALLNGIGGVLSEALQGARAQIQGFTGSPITLNENGVPRAQADIVDTSRTENGAAAEAEAIQRAMDSALRTFSVDADALQRRSIEAGSYRSALITAAFQLALAQNGGRITEQDFRKAFNSISAADPATAIAKIQTQRELVARQLDSAYRATFTPLEGDYSGLRPEAIFPRLGVSGFASRPQTGGGATPPPGARIISGADLLGGGQ